jgi:hypothetical protein
MKKIAMGSAHLKGLNLNKGVPVNSGELKNLIVFMMIDLIRELDRLETRQGLINTAGFQGLLDDRY